MRKHVCIFRRSQVFDSGLSLAAQSSFDDHLAHWCGLNSSQDQMVVDDYNVSGGMVGNCLHTKLLIYTRLVSVYMLFELNIPLLPVM